MGKCKICGTEIENTEEMCEDCKALDDVDLIKSDDELEELLNSVMHSHTSYSNKDVDSFVSSDEMINDPIKDMDNEYDSEAVSSQLDSITKDLLEQYNMQDDEEFVYDEVSKEEEPLSIDSLTGEEEQPLSIDSLTSEEEEPISTDSLTSEEEEPFSIDSLSSDEGEPISIDSFSSDEEASAIEEPFDIDSLMKEEEPNTPSADVALEEAPKVENDLYASIPGFEGIFDGIDDDERDVSDVGDIFSDVLGTVSNYGSDEDENIESGLKKSDKKEKKNFFKGLFENIENEETEKEFLKEKELEEAKVAQKAARKEQKKADKAAKKAKKEESKKLKIAAKANKKAEKKKNLAEEELDHSKINKKGAAVVLVAFAALGAFIILGSNTFAYSVSINQANDYFARKKYSKAYDKISGVDVKEDDQLLASQIKTVMYVNKEYDSYNNYYAIQYYAEALNSLLNGLTKYDVYLDEASELGVKSDLQFVKSQILDELEDKFHLDEEDARKIISIEDKEKYSDKVFAIAEKLVADNKK